MTRDEPEPLSEKARTAFAEVDERRATKLLLLGSGPFYLVHAPKATGARPFVVEVELLKAGLRVHELYKEDQRVTGERVYTMVPEAFVVDELAPTQRGEPPRLSFRADLYRGDADRRSNLMLRDVGVRVRRTFTVRGAFGRWFVFGNERELFATRFGPQPAVMKVWLTHGIPGDDAARAVQRGSLLSLDETGGEIEAGGRRYQVEVRKLAVLYGVD